MFLHIQYIIEHRWFIFISDLRNTASKYIFKIQYIVNLREGSFRTLISSLPPVASCNSISLNSIAFNYLSFVRVIVSTWIIFMGIFYNNVFIYAFTSRKSKKKELVKLRVAVKSYWLKQFRTNSNRKTKWNRIRSVVLLVGCCIGRRYI